MIESLLDQDFYKLTMGMATLHQFSNIDVECKFKCRNKIKWTQEIVDEINHQVDEYCKLSFTKEELTYLSNIRFLKKDYIDFLRLYHPIRNHIHIVLNKEELEITIHGPWFLIIYYEVPLLAIVNEVYFKYTTHSPNYDDGMERLERKLEIVKEEGFKFSDFGTRRRFSHQWQDMIINKLSLKKYSPFFTGTSNVFFAYKYGITPIGTMAHEWLQAGQAIGVRLIDSQKRMLQAWVDEYRGDLGIALTDVVGVDAFLRDFDLYFAKLYDGVRHDSGDPILWGSKILNHYEKLKINPATKTLVFSDSLTMTSAAKIYKEFKNKTNVAFGIGTHITNDFDGVTPLNVVIKMTKCNGSPVAKISDSPGKGMCEDEEYLHYLKSVFQTK